MTAFWAEHTRSNAALLTGTAEPCYVMSFILCRSFLNKSYGFSGPATGAKQHSWQKAWESLKGWHLLWHENKGARQENPSHLLHQWHSYPWDDHHGSFRRVHQKNCQKIHRNQESLQHILQWPAMVHKKRNKTSTALSTIKECIAINRMFRQWHRALQKSRVTRQFSISATAGYLAIQCWSSPIHFIL